eukprot:TRINITY_DN29689_c0_g1_i1.p2 TRINITY_DN29689_c0_g1~~TRINITY_DN29689_c0_g1_i1.p2  ORF type:complete len:122 (+),score=4.05 TRINITY_DN29689_c0_g1_i1:264-629(+)
MHFHFKWGSSSAPKTGAMLTRDKDITVVLPDGYPFVLPPRTTLDEVLTEFPDCFLSTCSGKPGGKVPQVVLHRELTAGKVYFLHPVVLLQCEAATRACHRDVAAPKRRHSVSCERERPVSH